MYSSAQIHIKRLTILVNVFRLGLLHSFALSEVIFEKLMIFNFPNLFHCLASCDYLCIILCPFFLLLICIFMILCISTV